MQLRSLSLGTAVIGLFALLVTGCSAGSSEIVNPNTPTPRPVLQIPLPTPTPKPVLQIPLPRTPQIMIDFFGGGDASFIDISGTGYASNVSVSVSLLAVPDQQGGLHGVGPYIVMSSVQGSWYLPIRYDCNPSIDISQYKVTVDAIDTDHESGVSTELAANSFCRGDNANNLTPGDFEQN